jgi:transcription termination/antitermination protein NusG
MRFFPLLRPRRRSVVSSVIAMVTSNLPEMHWYVLKVQSNRERTIRDALLKRIRMEGMGDFFGEIIIPTEKVAEKTKGGKKRVVERKLYPGYIMVQMVLNDETWYLVRDTGGVGDFTGTAGRPVPMQEEEITRMLGLEEAKDIEPEKVKIEFSPGEVVKIKEGAFENFEGTIDSIDESNGKITVLIEIFGRSTQVEIDYWQIELV